MSNHPNNPRVSVVTATWNRADFINCSIQSVIDQTFANWELIIISDGFDERLAKVVRQWLKKDRRIRYICVEHTGKIAAVSNVGLREARGEFVAILDDDDWWLDKKKLEKQIEFLDAHPGYIGCGGGFVIVDPEGNEISRFLKPETDEEIRSLLLYANSIVNSSSVFRREPAGLYDERIPQFADWDFWLRLGIRGKLYNFPEYFVAYRMWNKSSSFINQKENARSALMILKRYNKSYPGFFRAFIIAYSYEIYVLLFPVFFRRLLNPIVSRYKKKIFAGQMPIDRVT